MSTSVDGILTAYKETDNDEISVVNFHGIST